MGPLNSIKLIPKPRPAGNYVKLSDCEIHYSIEGKGPAIVLIHGWGASKYCWRFLTPLLSQKYTVYEIDLPGFGKSTKHTNVKYGLDDQSRRIAEFMDLKDIRKSFLVGSSLGGALALWMASKFPARVLAVIAISPAASRALLPIPIHRLSSFAKAVPKFMTHKIGLHSLNRVITRKELITEEALVEYMRPVLEDANALATMIKSAEALTDYRLADHLSKITVPIKILYGVGDQVIRRHHIDEALRYLPKNTELKTHPTAGHHSQEDEPQWVCDEISIFFK